MTDTESGKLPVDSLTVKKGLKIKMGWPLIVVLVIMVVLGGASIYFYSNYQKAQELLRNPTAAAQEEIRALTEKVGRHFQLPGGEEPTVATVSDTSKLAGQPFFAKAETGDKVLIFTQAGKAILYRPEIDKIIEVTQVNLQPTVAGTSTASAQLQTATLAIYNSTNTAGLASVAEKTIKAQVEQIQTLVKANSKKDNYAKTVVIILNQGAQSLGAKLADTVKADVSAIVPAGETKPNTDLLLILGEDFKP